MISKNNPLLLAALSYAARGWRVFPIIEVLQTGVCACALGPECDKAGKHPAITGWNKAATTDKATVTKWWTELPSRGIGIATGEASNLTVLDVDGDEGVEALSKLTPESGMPATPTAQSRKGRFHYYFSWAEGIKNGVQNLGTKLDTRSEGGYVVAPPSRHATGSVYTWLTAPDKVALAEWPEWLVPGGKKKDGKKIGRPQKETLNPANPADERRLLAALEFVDPDDEEIWGAVGWIMGRLYAQSDAGFAKYAAWAARSRKYNAKRTRGHYYDRSKEVRGSDIKTTTAIFKWAEARGYVNRAPEELEERVYHVFENPFKEETMVHEFIVAAAAAPRVFVMDKRLVRIVHYGRAENAGAAAIERDPSAYVVWDHDADTLAVELGNIAAFWTPKDGGHRRGGFSRRAITTFMSCREFSNSESEIKPLMAFVAHPTLRADGTLIEKVGYDAASKLFLTSDIKGLKVDFKLGRKAAAAAMQQLLAPFSEYPWATAGDRAVFVAALFTVGLRHLFEVAPLFAFSSPKHGSGKTQLAECISRLWYGTTLSKATWTPNPEEMEKRIAAFLLAGDRIVCLDNVPEGARLEDTTLNKVLTSRLNTFRILGRTERVELTNEATWFATGNQITLAGDISRRALMCYLDAHMMDPGSRSFVIPNLPNHIIENRVALMGAALSIAASWMAAGRPVLSVAHREYGSFTDWYGVMRPLLLWAGEEDLATQLDAVREDDDEDAVLSAWANALKAALPPDGTQVGVAEVLKLCERDSNMRAAFTGCFEAGREPNFRTLGGLLRRCENKIFVSEEGEQFAVRKTLDKHSNVFRWACANN